MKSENSIIISILLIIQFIIGTNYLFSQTSSSYQDSSLYIEGIILNEQTKEVLPYANIYNTTKAIGTISNEKGYFKLEINFIEDELRISFVGFENKTIRLSNSTGIHKIYLTEQLNVLNEVLVYGSDPTLLYEIALKTKKSSNKSIRTGKSYFYLKSFYNQTQIEQVEAFHNSKIRNYDLEYLDLKTGRVALHKFNDRIFTNLETSRAFIMNKTFEGSGDFPLSPLELNIKKAKKNFGVNLQSKYADEKGDSIWVIHFYPKKDSSLKFLLTVWVNPKENYILKAKYEIKNAKKYPFKPMFIIDTIVSLDMEIVKTFIKVNSNVYVNHIDFNYTINYKSRNAPNYQIETRSVLHVFDWDDQFELPYFIFSDDEIGDYRKINAFPHNDLFWNKFNSFDISEQYNANDNFYNHPQSITNKIIFNSNKYGPTGLFEHPYVQWTGKRVLFKPNDTIGFVKTVVQEKTTAKSMFYDLSVKIFLDVNQFKDTLQALSKTIFDPFESYFMLPMDTTTHCFINIYFDLVEIERIKMMEKINNSDKKPLTIKNIHFEATRNISFLKEKYFSETERGENRKNLKKWSNKVFNELKIDNYSMFFPNKN